MSHLNWVPHPENAGCATATLGNPERGDGVTFHQQHMPTCYRRGPFRVLIEIASGPKHHAWGCFDEQDFPLRHYHKVENLRDEMEAIAAVLLKDRRWDEEVARRHAQYDAEISAGGIPPEIVSTDPRISTPTPRGPTC